MAILRCVEAIGAREGPEGRKDGQRSYRTMFHVTTSGPTINGVDIKNYFYAGNIDSQTGYVLPKRGSGHPNDAAARCTGIVPKQVANSAIQWEVTALWDSTYDPRNDADNPWDRPVKWRWTKAKYTEAPFKDRNGTDILNSAKQTFDPPFLLPYSNPILVVVQNTEAFDPSTIVEFADLVNAEPFCGVAPGWVKSESPEATEEQSEGTSYWQVTWQFEFASKHPWDPIKILDVGCCAYVDVEVPGPPPAIVQRLRFCVDGMGTPSTKPQFLDGVGYQQNPNDPQSWIGPQYREFPVYNVGSYGKTGFGNLFTIKDWPRVKWQ